MFKLLKDKRTLAVAVFILGALSLIAYGMKHRGASGVARTIHFRQTWTGNDGSVKVDADMIKYTRADGFWKAVQTNYSSDGTIKTIDVQFGSPDKHAAFQVDDKNKLLVLTGPIYHASHTLDLATARRDPSFVREDSFLAYPVVVYRLAEDAKDYVELYRSLELDEYLKTVKVNSAGHTTIEAISIELGEPTAEQLKVPGHPVNFEFYKAMIRSTEKQGQKERADSMRQALAELERTLR